MSETPFVCYLKGVTAFINDTDKVKHERQLLKTYDTIIDECVRTSQTGNAVYVYGNTCAGDNRRAEPLHPDLIEMLTRKFESNLLVTSSYPEDLVQKEEEENTDPHTSAGPCGECGFRCWNGVVIRW